MLVEGFFFFETFAEASLQRDGIFLFPTKPLALLSRKEIGRPRTLGLVPATAGYVDDCDWVQITDVGSKPLVAQGLLEGLYDAGLTHLEYAERYPDELRVVEKIGEIDTTWIVYGTRKRLHGDLIGIPSPGLFQPAHDAPPIELPVARAIRSAPMPS